MLARFLKRSEPFNFIIFILFLLVWVVTYVFQTETDVKWWTVFITATIVMLSFLVQLGMLSYLSQKYQLSKITDFTIWVWLMLLGVFPQVLVLNKVLWVNLILFLVFQRLLSLRNQTRVNSKLFDAGFLVGISFLVYPSSILFLLGIYVSYFIYIRIIDKKLFIPLIGFLIPIFLVYVYLETSNQSALFISLIELNLYPGFLTNQHNVFYLSLILLLVIVFGLLFRFISIDTFSELETERNYKFIIAQVFIVLLLLFLDKTSIAENLLFLFFPASILIGNGIAMVKKDVFQSLFIYLITLLALVRFFVL